ncbi:MAG: GGDEF domain-containing protein [Nitrospirae bacterium]|nr:GGDEF domain-containing protein [Magnetococcales bacterium]
MSTTILIETLYDLLRQTPPETQKVLALIDGALAAGVCAYEKKQGKKNVEGLLNILGEWWGAEEGVPLAIDHCRQFEGHGYDLRQFIQACTPLCAYAGPRWQTKNDHNPSELAPRIWDALEMLAKHHDTVADAIKTIPSKPPSMEQLIQTLEFMDIPGRVTWEDQNNLGNDWYFDKAWRRLEAELKEIVPGDGWVIQPKGTSDHSERMVHEDDLESRISHVIEWTEDWMREVGRVGEQLDENRQKGEKLKIRIDALEVALAASQMAHFMDPQTGLSDHSSFSVRLNRLLDRASHLGEIFSIGVIRLENYDALEKSLTADAMALMIREMAEEIRKHLDGHDFIARIAPDRLGILFPRTGSERSTSVITELNQSLYPSLSSMNPGISRMRIIGGSLSFGQGMTVKDIMVRVAQLANELDSAKVGAGSNFGYPIIGSEVSKEPEFD